MERLSPPKPGPGAWQIATVQSVKQETHSVRSYLLAVPNWVPHLPGQHYDVRLTAPDGYQAQRSYSVASSPLDTGVIELTIDRLPEGEVSAYFHDVVVAGDRVEVRGPFASHFVWRGEAPALLVGGGSGVVPLVAMLRHRRRTAPGSPMRLVYSVRTARDVIFAGELGDETTLTFSRSAPEGWTGHTGRVDKDLIAATAFDSGWAYVCGSNGFVETATGLLLESGYSAGRIKTERFGPSG